MPPPPPSDAPGSGSSSSSALKALLQHLTLSSPQQRQRLLIEARDEIKEKRVQLTDPMVKVIARHLPLCLPLLTDGAGRFHAEQFVELLLQENACVAGAALLQSLWERYAHWRNLVPSTANAKTAYVALKWTAAIFRRTSREAFASGPPARRLIQLQAILASVIFSCPLQRLVRSAQSTLGHMWSSSEDGRRAMNSFLSEGVADMDLQLLQLGAYYVRWLVHVCKDQDQANKIRPVLLEATVKLVLQTKTKTSMVVVKNLSPLLKQVSHDEFKGVLLPAAQKAMLRNPEVTLEAVGLILQGLNIDLSQYVAELQKPLGSNLHAKDDATRDSAVLAVRSLAAQCSDSDCVMSLLKNIFAVLGGSEGKLSANAQKMSLLEAAGAVSQSPITGASVQAVCEKAVELFVKVLETEVHEGTLLLALDQLSKWTGKLQNAIPPKLVDFLPKGLALKSATSSVRSGYFLLLRSCLRSSTLSSALPLVPNLLKAVDSCSRQASQASSVGEGAHAASCLVKLSQLEGEADLERQLEPFWKLSLDAEKQLFVNERFLMAAAPQALGSLCELAEKVILDKMLAEETSNTAWFRAVAVAMTSDDATTRAAAGKTAKRLVQALGGDRLAESLIDETSRHVWRVEDTLSAAQHGKEEGSVNAKFVADALKTVASACDFADDREKSSRVARRLIKPCHHPVVFATDPNLWPALLARLGLDSRQFFTLEEDVLGDVVSFLGEEGSAKAAGRLAAKTLVRVSPDMVGPRVVRLLEEQMAAARMVTAEDYEIFLTPEGEVFDKRVVESAQGDNEAKNVKRESKAYSYKDQLEEIALKKELEEKRRREGKISAPKLTPKQKEALRAQLEKEAKVREEVREVYQAADPVMELALAAVRGRPEAFALLAPRLDVALVKSLRSPVTASSGGQIVYELRRAVLTRADVGTLAQEVAGLTVQVLRPACPMKETLKDKALVKSAQEVVRKLVKTTEEGELMSAPAVGYAFHLVDFATRKAIPDKTDDAFVTLVCDFLSRHATALRDAKTCKSALHPNSLPRRRMLTLLIEIVSRRDGRVQQKAVQTLIDVAGCASGAAGCARASADEISVLLRALECDTEAVRDAGLRGLKALSTAFPRSSDVSEEDEHLRGELLRRVWVAKYDPVAENRLLADALWAECKFRPDDSLCMRVIGDVTHPVGCVRSAGAEALAKLLESRPNDVQTVLTLLLETYEERLEMSPAVLDAFGRQVEAPIDHWEPRSGIALALAKIAPFFSVDMVEQAASFFVPDGLGDRHEVVRKHMLDAAVATINLHGKDTAEELLPVFEDFLDNAPKSGGYDSVRQSVVILMGSLAKHLDPSDDKVRPILKQLILALNTPSQQVQEAVANCLPPLIPAIKDEAPSIVSNLITTLLGASVGYGERKGAAYGLAGVVKGLGILSLKQLDIMGKLTEAIQDKKTPAHREGALFAFEMLCTMLGRLFEPYIVHILPHLLLCFGDSVEHVRTAADDTARAVMSKLSAHGVKLVLPSLLNALEEDQWRTKTGSVELLGAMAFCAPKQLSSCLPAIVPKLIEVLGDSHHKVQKAGAQALKQIGAVIRNPEIQAIVPNLLKALQDPGSRTGNCLQTLLETKFVHFIDAPSLALIMPVVQRAFQDRSTETRKMAAQIIGNMYSLTDQKDLSPYLPGIIPGLKASLLDPVPEVRAVSAKALGAMVKGMGEDSFEELLPWLMATLTSETSSVDRSGAAQGLAEVVGGLGVDKMNSLMPEIIETAERQDIAPHVKDGYIMMFVYMPSVFPEEFTPYIGQIISPVLRALADENEFVRETAYKAGQRLVMSYAESSISLLLPELENGLLDENWRIRHSSVQLLGDLLYKISGVTGKMTTESGGEDDNFGTEASQRVVMEVLGLERRNRVLSGLYMGRSDVALMVRQASLHVWKVIVSNTPKTLREILPTLFNMLLSCLASNSYDKRQVAARTLGDLVKKLGERVLPEIIPILETGLSSEQPEKRQGVCVGLSEIMTSTSRDMVLTFVDSLVPTVRRALCDDLGEVREAAAVTFDALHNTVGQRALDDILPAMLKQLDDPELHDNALDGLRQVMAIKSRAVLPYLVPQLISKPVNFRALASLAPVAGEALHRHLGRILPAMLQALAAAEGDAGLDDETKRQQLEFAQTVVLSVSDDDESDTGVSSVMEELLQTCKSPSVEARRPAVALLNAFCAQTRADYSQYVTQLIRSLILVFTTRDDIVLQQAWQALTAVVKTLEPGEQMDHVADVRQAVRFAMGDVAKERRAAGKDKVGEGEELLLPGFCLPKGIAPVLPVFRESVLNGGPELKEQAAMGLGELIQVTSPAALKPSVVHITGPLIRILGDRFSHSVKVAVLDTLGSLLSKAKDMLKPFFPQLQTTFMKALNDVNRAVRLKAGAALGQLITIHMRPDPLFNELYNGIKNADDTSVRDTYVQAMRGCVEPSGGRVSAPIRRQIAQLLASYLSHGDDSSRTAAGGCLGALFKWLPDDEATPLADEHLAARDDVALDWTLRHGRSTALFVALKDCPDKVCADDRAPKVEKAILDYLSADRVPVVENALRAAGFLFQHCVKTGQPLPPTLITPFCKAMNHGNNDVKLLLAVVTAHLAKTTADDVLPKELLKPLLPMLVNGTKEKNSAVKASCESALVCVLGLRRRNSKDGQAKCLDALESGARDALQDVITRVLQRVANQPEGKEEVIDNTVLV